MGSGLCIGSDPRSELLTKGLQERTRMSRHPPVARPSSGIEGTPRPDAEIPVRFRP